MAKSIAWLLAATAVLLVPLRLEALAPPHDSTADPGISCGSCHSMHGGYGLVPRGAQQEAMCKSCHNPTGQADGMTEVANHVVRGGSVTIDCGSCHDPHGPQEVTDPHTGQTDENLKLIRGDPQKYYSEALELAVFQERPGHFAFDDSNPPWNGICQTCHTETDHHRKDSGSSHKHNMGLTCTVCHLHDAGFNPESGCSACHDKVQNGRRRISGSNGDFEKNSHHVTGSVQDSDCAVCHYTGSHSEGTVKLKDPDQGDSLIYDYDPTHPEGLENFCLNCHDSDGAAAGNGSQPFSDGQTPPDLKSGNKWANSAHNQIAYSQNGGTPITCFGNGSTTGCHGNAHGSDNQKLLSASSGVTIDQFCFNCHTNGKITNNALSGAGLADDIEQAFGLTRIHDLDTTFTSGSNTYTLQCTTCHNPHVVSGKHWSVDQGKSPVTRPDFGDPVNNPRAMGTRLWGDGSDEKIDYYAGSGTYRTPDGDTFSGSVLPDYATFCLDCHGQSGPVSQHFNLDWSNDPHGGNSANSPNGGGTCPDRYTCGKAMAWDGDECTGTEEQCWPVVIRGRGDQLWSRGPYDHEDRIAGANFVLSCTDCHEAHGSTVRSMLRTVVNGGPGSYIWNTMCNNCHYYYSDWHSGMSCGNASCHGSDDMNAYGGESIHRMANKYGTGATRSFDFNLVADMRFENNLNDSGTWRMHGRWYDTAGSYAAGKSGNAVVLNGDQPIEIGTRNSYWSTDEGQHGTWKYSEMKYNMTLEAWVYPTDDANDENHIFSKHTYTSGGYALLLKKVGGTLRAALLTNVNPGQKGVWDSDCNGLRGAYSTVPVPLNQWTHVAATYDSSLPDRDPNDPSVGRIRIYVNGEDVTTSNQFVSGECYAQPGAGETTMFPYSAHNDDPVGECYNDSWCASALSIGGVMWGSGNRKGLIGRIDEAKVWNITKDATYFETADSQSPPRISFAEGVIGSDKLRVVFSEGVYSNAGGSGALTPSDFTFTDIDNGRTIVSVAHLAGASNATLSLSSPLDDSSDLFTDTLAAAADSIYDEYDNPAGTEAVVISVVSTCPTGETSFQFSEPAASSHILDGQKILTGAVNDPAQTILGDGYYHGDGADNYIDFEYNNSCLQATRALTAEMRLKPSGLEGNSKYIKRILARDAGGNYQVSVWRNNSWATYNAPDGVASIALWIKPADAHGGRAWKPVLTHYDTCPIVSDHWYRVKVVWNTDKTGGTPDNFFVPADIFVDDQGTDGNGAGENWSGYNNCTDSSQSLLPDDRKLYTGDEILPADGDFVIGANVNNHGNNVFNGLIDWISWQKAVDYTGVDEPPNPPQ